MASVTAYSGDGGIDVVLEHDGEPIGVQVKRYRQSVRVEYIRAFAGALVLREIPQGVFVTTSKFQKGCASAVRGYSHRGIEIELVDGQRLFEALGIRRRPQYKEWSEIFADPTTDLVCTYANMIC